MDKRIVRYIKSVEAQEAVQRAGLFIPDKPDEQFELPRDCSEEVLSDDELGRLMFLAARWVGYAEVVSAVADIEVTGAGKVYDFIQSAVLVLQESKTVTEGKARRDIDDRVDYACQIFLEKDGINKMSGAVLRGYRGDSAALSRELSRRGYVLEKMKAF